jgi:hypothetical protein
MSAPNANNTAPAANPSTSSSVPKWGEPGFVAVDGARYGEDGFVPCGRPGHIHPRATLRHTADECASGGPSSATKGVRRGQPARGRGRQNNFPGSGQQNIFSSLLGQQTNDPALDSDATYAAMASTFTTSFTNFANNISDMHRARRAQQEQQQQQQQQPSLSMQQLQLQNQNLQLQLQLAQQSQQQPPSPRPSRRGGRQGPTSNAQRNGVKKNQKRGTRKHWQPITRKDDNNGSGGNGSAGTGSSAQV